MSSGAREALDELTELWLAADAKLRKAITDGAHYIDQTLQFNPEQHGESRPDDVRIFFAHPLGVLFEIVQDHGTVRILHVWDIRRKK